MAATENGTRAGALARAEAFFDGGGFKSLLSDLVAIPYTAQEEGREADLDRLADAIEAHVDLAALFAPDRI